MTTPSPSATAVPKQTPTGFLRSLWPWLRRYQAMMVGAVMALAFTALINLAMGQGIRWVIDNGISAASEQALNQALLAVMALVVAMAGGTFVRFYLVTGLGERIAADLRNDVFAHLLRLQPAYFEQNHSGDIMSRLTTDTTLLQSIIGSSLSMALRGALTVVGGLIMLFVTDVQLSLIVLVGVPAVLGPVLWMGRRVRTLSRQSQDSIASVGSYAGEAIRQIKTVQSYSRESFERAAFARETARALEVAKARIAQRATLMATVILLAFSVIAVMVWVGGREVMSGGMSGGELASFVFYAVMVAFGVASVSEVYGELQRAAGATERLLELLAEQPRIVDAVDPAPTDPTSNTHLQASQLCFAYPSRTDTPALIDLDFSIRRGETVALVGPSGAGKSSLFEMLLRFYDPDSGSIKLLGTELKQLKVEDLRSRMALVPQQPVLFSSDIWQNIRYGRPEACDEDVIAAAKAAHAHDFIRELPDGYASAVGENGTRLSGGQKQRIVIARAILNNPEVLLLDEATSALDAESEHRVQKALEVLMQGRTTLIIAHRLATVVNADRIFVMQHGRIEAVGSHAELLEASPLYQRLAELQFDGQVSGVGSV